MTEPEPMQAGVVNILLTIDPVASHAARKVPHLGRGAVRRGRDRAM